jgi:hypothetical protein
MSNNVYESRYLEPIQNSESIFSEETIRLNNEAINLAELVTEIRDWLISQNTYRCIIKIDEQSYQLDALFGITAAPEDTSNLPKLDCPFAHKIKPLIK